MEKRKEDSELKQQMKAKQDEQKGILEKVDAEGNTILIVNAFKQGTYDARYNGEYVIARIEVRHQDLWGGLANKSMKSGNLEMNIEEAAQKIVKGRAGQNIQVKHVMIMLQNDGVDPEGRFAELTDDEKTLVNATATNHVDLVQVYSNIPEMLHRLIVKYPDGLKLEKQDDWGHFHPGLGKEMFDRCMALLMTKFTMQSELQKK